MVGQEVKQIWGRMDCLGDFLAVMEYCNALHRCQVQLFNKLSLLWNGLTSIPSSPIQSWHPFLASRASRVDVRIVLMTVATNQQPLFAQRMPSHAISGYQARHSKFRPHAVPDPVLYIFRQQWQMPCSAVSQFSFYSVVQSITTPLPVLTSWHKQLLLDEVIQSI